MPKTAGREYQPHNRTRKKDKVKPLSKWERKQFISIDGEGENEGKEETHRTKNKIYKSRSHKFTLLAASTGESLYDRGKRLDSFACLDWLCELGGLYPKGIFVIFAGGYDVNHILWGIERALMEEITTGATVEFEHKNEWYLIQLRSRKSLTVKRGKNYIQNKKGAWVVKWQAEIVLWDVWGFFQDSFVGVMGKWLGKTHHHFDLIKRMKAKRGDFENVPQKEINDYNRAELECLTEVMLKVHEGIDGLGLQCMRFDGAGAVAASMMRKHKIKEHKQETPEAVLEASCTAYAGGRIEICKIGHHKGPVYDYDINSAYPSVLKDLPCLACGHWEMDGHNKVPRPGFTLVHIKYAFVPGKHFYPLFYRTEAMKINYPDEGEGWYWYPEYEAALLCKGKIEVLSSWHFVDGCNHKPFGWVLEYYNARREWIKRPTAEWQRGGEKIIKLGLNSLYGKTAQQVGGRQGIAPAYHQLEWAGYITSATRARLYKAAMLKPDAIIGFATDGIFSTKKLLLECSTDKQIGMWELKEPVPDGLTVVMAGIYWWHNGDKSFTHFSRGFDKDAMETPAPILAAWKRGDTSIDIPMRRLIGMGTACTSDIFWQLRGRFVESVRTLALDGHSHKRSRINVKRDKPYMHLVDLLPGPNVEYHFGAQGCSYPYPLKWLEEAENDDYETELETQRETDDTENI